jgi:hypothetical protein
MPKPQRKKHTLWLRDGDWDYIESIFAPNGTSTSEAIRTLVSHYVDNKRAQEEEQDAIDVRINI